MLPTSQYPSPKPTCPQLLPLPSSASLSWFTQVRKRSRNCSRISSLAAPEGVLWLGGDEGRSLYRLQRVGEHRYGDLQRVKLKDFDLAGGKGDGESDIEGLALNGDRLWLVGSHSLRRRKHNDREGPPLDLHDDQSRNAHVLGCLRLDSAGLPVAGQRVAFDTTSPSDALTKFLADNPRIAAFLAIPSKERTS
jgi:hypothetical protein